MAIRQAASGLLRSTRNDDGENTSGSPTLIVPAARTSGISAVTIQFQRHREGAGDCRDPDECTITTRLETNTPGDKDVMYRRQPCVYILTNKRNGTLYVGVTSNLETRIWQHKHQLVDGFTKKYRLHRLVYYELQGTMYTAISREKQVKAGSRRKKLALIESINPGWKDLYEDLCQ